MRTQNRKIKIQNSRGRPLIEINVNDLTVRDELMVQLVLSRLEKKADGERKKEEEKDRTNLLE